MDGSGLASVDEISTAKLTTIMGHLAPDPDLTITINGSDLDTTMIGTSTSDDPIAAGKAKVVDSWDAEMQSASTLIQFELALDVTQREGGQERPGDESPA